MSNLRKKRVQDGRHCDGRRQAERHISVRSVRRTPTDVRKLGRAIIRMTIIEADAERAAQAAHARPAGDATESAPGASEASHDE